MVSTRRRSWSKLIMSEERRGYRNVSKYRYPWWRALGRLYHLSGNINKLYSSAFCQWYTTHKTMTNSQDYEQREITLHTSISFQLTFKFNEIFFLNFTIYREKRKICRRLCDNRMSSNSTNPSIESLLLIVIHTTGSV